MASTGRLSRLAVAVLGLSACSTPYSGPSPESRNIPVLLTYCHTAGPGVACSVVMFYEPGQQSSKDVTAQAVWSTVPPELATFNVPGLLTPKGSGAVRVSAVYKSWSSVTLLGFLIEPGQNARYLTGFSTHVTESDKTTAVVGATVTMLSGYKKGASCVTTGFGRCGIDDILAGENFTAVVSKSGYDAVTFMFNKDESATGGFIDVVLTRSK